MKTTKYQYRFLARIVIEAKTPLAVGSGDNNVLTDALVATDANGLPYIPGTSIAGVIRSMIEDKQLVKNIFGFQEKKDGEGSKIIFTEAKLLNNYGLAMDGLCTTADCSDFLKQYQNLPIRQHTKINHRGTTADRAKFDEQVVYAGSRFCFEMEMVAENDAEDKTNFEKALEQIFKSSFRIGGGTRSGFGEIDVVEIKESILNLAEPKQLQLYLDKSSNLQDSATWTGWQKNKKETIDDKQWTEYILNLKAEDFIMFGSGFGDEDVDAVPVKEKRVKWTNDGKGEIKEEVVLIPGTSVKGAIAHRTAFYYNKLNNRFAGEQGDNEPKVGTQNEAVVALFGKEGESTKDQTRGNVIISDVFADKALQEKIFDHVAIDRFTGGAVDGALFNEKAIYAKDESFTIRILVKKSVLDYDKDKNIKEAFENALRDICKGLLPLGGAVNKGYGMFSEIIICEGKSLNLEEVNQ